VETAATEQPPGLVVLLALVRIRQYVVGFGDLLEALFGSGVAGVLIRMVVTSQLAVSLISSGLASLATPRTL
jgi:hypothetical protein